MTTNYTKLNALQISRECLQMIYETLEPAQAGEIIMALYQYFYEGIEPTFDTKLMNGIWKTCLTFTQTKADAFMRQHRNFFNRVENPKTKTSDLSHCDSEMEQVIDEPVKVSQNEEKGPSEALYDSNNVQSTLKDCTEPIKRRYNGVERAFGNSIFLLDGKTFEEALKSPTVQRKIEYGDVTEQEIYDYLDHGY